MKKIVFILVSFSFSLSFSQETKLVKLLNYQLNKEISSYPKYDSLKVIKPFHINEQKKLILEHEKYETNWEHWEVTKQEVLLSDISSLDKDINIILSTEGDKVLVTTKIYSNKRELIRTEITYNNMFFTQIYEEKRNKKFRDKLLKAFANAGYTINFEFWYD